MIKNNILAFRLLRAVFFSYFIVAVTVTIFQMIAEFNHVKERIGKEINYLSKSFAPGIAEGLWRYDKNGINASLFGMTQQNVVLGVAVYDTSDKLYSGSGWVVDNNNKPYFIANKKGSSNGIKKGQESFNGVPYRFDFPLEYDFKGTSSIVGKVSIFSGSEIVLEQVKYGFIIILVNSIIKTIALWIIFFVVIHYLVSKPIQSLKVATSQLTPDKNDFSFDVDLTDEEGLIKRKDELGTFAKTLVGLRDALKSRDQVIKMYISTIEQQVEEKTQNIRLLLNSIKQGIFTIDKEQKIQDEYSAYLNVILEGQKINSKKISHLLFEQSNLSTNSQDEVVATLVSILGENEICWELNSHLLPRNIVWQPGPKIEKHLEIDWEPIVSENTENIDKIMIVLRDISEVIQIKKEIEGKKIESETISLLLNGNYTNASKALIKSKEMLTESIELLESHDEISDESVKVIYRNLHTIKGSMRTYKLSLIADEVHKVEEVYSYILKEGTKPNSHELSDQLKEVYDITDHYSRDLKQKIVQFDQSKEDSLADQAIIDCLNVFKYIPSELQEKKEIKVIQNILKRVNYLTISSLLEDLIDSLPSISMKLGKKRPEVFIEDEGIGFSRELHDTLRNIFTHLFSNSLDHGIEPEIDRIKKGKSPHGKISLRVEKHIHNSVRFSYFDDGNGINLKKVKEKANTLGYKTDSFDNEKLAMLIFEPGFSTRNEANKISGRGMGMDIIKADIEKSGGSVFLKLEDSSIKHHFSFELHIVLPASYTDLGDTVDLLAS